MNRDLTPPTLSVCTKFQVDSSNTIGLMPRKPNLTFVTCDLENHGHDPITNIVLQGPKGSYIPGMKLIALKLFELSRGNRCVFGQTDGQTDRQTDRQTAP